MAASHPKTNYFKCLKSSKTGKHIGCKMVMPQATHRILCRDCKVPEGKCYFKKYIPIDGFESVYKWRIRMGRVFRFAEAYKVDKSK